jgi:hypothetical protein
MKSKLRKAGSETNAEIVARSMHRMRNPLIIIATEKGIATKDFKKKLGCHYMTIRSWYMNAPRIRTITKIAKKLKVHPTKLMYDVMTWRAEKWDRNPIAYVCKHIKSMD